MLTNIERDIPDNLPESRTSSINQWNEKIIQAKKFFEKDFKEMRTNWRFNRGLQWAGQQEDDSRYIANFVQHHIKNLVSSLYARNPTVITKKNNRLVFEIWDEDPNSLAMAQQNIQMAMQSNMQPDINDLLLIQDVNAGLTHKKMLDRIGKTLDIVSSYEMGEQPEDFKLQMKMLISRVAITGVGYIKLLYQREMEYPRKVKTQIYDTISRLQTINRLASDLKDGEVNENSAEEEELRIALSALEQEEKIMIREGLIFEFPKATKVIIDTSCTCLEGFIDANWIAQEINLTSNDIKEFYGKDVKTMGTLHNDVDSETGERPKRDTYKVWEIQDKKTGTFFTICEGYSDYLKEPEAPNVKVESFFTIKALVLNKAEDEDKIYPISDVFLLRSIQEEYNRNREALRQHRIANRPLYFADKGSFENDTEDAIIEAPPHSVIYVNSDGEARLSDKIQPVQKTPIDPNIYQTADIFADTQRVTGAPDSQFGGTSKATATENSIAASTRMTVTSSNSDDIDGFLTRVFRDVGVILMSNMDIETVKKIAGKGAVWPQLSYEEIIDEIYLSIEAGSSGRPNKAQDVANFERLAPHLMQMPGINPNYIAKYAIKILEDGIDLTEALTEGNPSIMAMNNMNQLSTGDSLTDPNQQGANGGNNAQSGNKPQGASQSMFRPLQGE